MPSWISGARAHRSGCTAGSSRFGAIEWWKAGRQVLWGMKTKPTRWDPPSPTGCSLGGASEILVEVRSAGASAVTGP